MSNGFISGKNNRSVYGLRECRAIERMIDAKNFTDPQAYKCPMWLLLDLAEYKRENGDTLIRLFGQTFSCSAME